MTKANWAVQVAGRAVLNKVNHKLRGCTTLAIIAAAFLEGAPNEWLRPIVA
jgi:hypothetical protein